MSIAPFNKTRIAALRDYIITVSAAGCAPIMLQAYNTEHVMEKIQACMPGVTVLNCKLRKSKHHGKVLLGVPHSQRSYVRPLSPGLSTNA